MTRSNIKNRISNTQTKNKKLFGFWYMFLIFYISFFILICSTCNIVFAAKQEAAQAKPTSKSAIIISNKIDVKKITPGKPLTLGKTSLPAAQAGTSAPIIVDKNAKVIKGDKKHSFAIITLPDKGNGSCSKVQGQSEGR